MPESTILVPPAAVQPEAPAVASLLRAPVLTRLELAVAIISTLLVCYLHVFFCQNVGALWRDEANSVAVATLPTFSELWRSLEFDSFPVLYFGVLRVWTALFGADNDMALRVLGLLMGLGIVGALWLNARQFGVRAPFLSLVLLGCNPQFVRYVDSNRAYGLGLLLMLLTLAAVWRVVLAPRPVRVLLAMAAAVLSVQTIYYNSVLLFAVCVAGAVVAGSERRWRTVACILSVGVPAALSLLIYLGTIHRMHEWSFLVQMPMDLHWLWTKLCEVTGSPDPLGMWLWPALVVGALGGAAWYLRRGAPLSDDARRTILFAAIALAVLTVGYTVFLRVLRYATQPWYYIAFLALAAICLDAVSGRLAAPSPGARALRLAFVLAMAALTFPPAYHHLYARQTNADLQGAQLNRKAVAGDLVVCTHWECAVSLERYYHGQAALVTLPPIDDHRFHRYDLAKVQMMTPDAAAPVLARIEETLRAGHRVWLSGQPLATEGDQPPPAPPPARMVGGMFAVYIDYYDDWSAQAGYLLRRHAVKSASVPVLDGQPVVTYERIPLTVFEGWR